MLTTFNDNPNLLKKVITGDGSWVYGYDIKTKVQSSQWKRPQEPRPKKARQVRSNVRVLFTVFFKKVITGDASWVYDYDIETKAESYQWKRPRPKKARQVRSSVKVLLSVLFNCNGVAHHEFLSQGCTINKEYYLEVIAQSNSSVTDCGETNHGFCAMRTHQHTHRCLCVSFWPKTKP